MKRLVQTWQFLSFSKSSTKLGVVTPMVFKGVGVASVKSLNLTQPLQSTNQFQPKNTFFGESLLQTTLPLTNHQPSKPSINQQMNYTINQPTNHTINQSHHQPINHTKWLTSRRLQLQSLCPIAQGQSNPSPPNARCWLSCNPNAPGKIWESGRVDYMLGACD